VTIRIVTDSACDLPESLATDLGIEIVPLSIRFGDTEYIDRVELSTAEFWAKAAVTPTLPATAAPAPGAFEEVFRRAAADGATGVVVVSLSGALSATMQSAELAARSVADEIDVRVIDSLSLTGGLGTMVLDAAAAAEAGADADAVEALVTSMISRTEICAALDTLENLKKGGRVGSAKALLGSMLSVKPIIRIVDGAVEEAGKQRTRRRALEFLRDRLFEEPSVSELSVLHGEAPDVDDFLEMIAPRYPRESIRLGKIGAVIGTHGGPGVIGICYLKA
jgi:DegV family protein with EDD domain